MVNENAQVNDPKEASPENPKDQEKETAWRVPMIQVIAAMLWPSFLTAGIATALFFTAFDPIYIFSEYDVSRMGAYSIGFLLFWTLTASSCVLSAFFLRPCHTPCKVIREQQAKEASENN